MSAVKVPARDVRHGRERPATAVRFAAVRLIPAAVLVWALIAALGLILTHLLAKTAFERWDGSVDRGLAGHRSHTWNTITHVLASMAETLPVIVIGLVFFVGLRIVLGRWRESLFLALTLIGEVTIFVCATLVIHRARPAVAHLDQAPPTSSFPSGHTAASVALYAGLAVVVWYASDRGWLRALAILFAVAIPIAVAFARLYRGMHYPTDVMAGALLGALWLGITARVVLVKDR
ncbi:MAG: phosphoesterase PA-phosphatase [Pseudonocardiales bacterium]|nr:MAG: phosphoesterase PA-phosphatase [Pseudonocardiales bacterium]